MTGQRSRMLPVDVVGDVPDPTGGVDLGWDTPPPDPPGEPPRTWLVPVRPAATPEPADEEFW